MSEPVILLVEDQEDNRVLARKLLARAGFRVVQAVSGPQAIEQAAHVLPDLVLLDLSLPEIDGWTVARTLRQRPDLGRVPIVAPPLTPWTGIAPGPSRPAAMNS